LNDFIYNNYNTKDVPRCNGTISILTFLASFCHPIEHKKFKWISLSKITGIEIVKQVDLKYNTILTQCKDYIIF
jgi:hypothetical protein